MKTNILEKFLRIKQDIEDIHGPFLMFALLEKSDAPGIDVVFAAEWTIATPDRSAVSESIGIISEHMLRLFSQDELSLISGIIPLQPNHPLVSEVLSGIEPADFSDRPYIHLRNLIIYDIAISQAYILAADPNYMSNQEAVQPLQAVA